MLVPGTARTEAVRWFDGVDLQRARMSWMEPEPVARAALDALGRRPSVIPGVFNKVMHFVSTWLLSRRNMSSLFARMMRPAIPAERL